MSELDTGMGQLPPRNIEAEQAVLGSLLIDNAAFEPVYGRIGPEDFYLPGHRHIFEAIHSLLDEGFAADLVTLTERCRHRGTLEAIGGAAALVGLLDKTPSAANAEYYARLVADAAQRRRAIEAATALARVAADPTAGPADLAAAVARVAGQGEAAEPLDKPEPVYRRLTAVEAKTLGWLWPERVPLGKLTLIMGDPGRGKSLLSLDMAARVTRGYPWPDGAKQPAPEGSVVLLSAEDDTADTIRPRLEAADGDPARVIELQAVRAPGAPEGRGFNLATDVAALERVIAEARDVRLVVIDPLSAYLGGLDTHNNAEVRGMMAPVVEMAERTGVAVVAITHLNKNAAASVLYRATGSLAFVAAARAVWSVLPEEGNPRRVLFLPVKCNLAGDVPGMAYHVEEHPERPGVPVIAWDPEPVHMSASDALAVTESETSSRNERAADWLRELLGNGPVASQEVEERARNAGFGRNTLARAKRSLGVLTGPMVARGKWMCRLPANEFPMSG